MYVLSSNRSSFLPDLQMASATGPQWNGYWKIPQDEIEIKEQIGKGAQARNVFRAFWKTRPVAAKNITFFSDREVRQNYIVRYSTCPACFLHCSLIPRPANLIPRLAWEQGYVL